MRTWWTLGIGSRACRSSGSSSSSSSSSSSRSSSSGSGIVIPRRPISTQKTRNALRIDLLPAHPERRLLPTGGSFLLFADHDMDFFGLDILANVPCGETIFILFFSIHAVSLLCPKWNRKDTAMTYVATKWWSRSMMILTSRSFSWLFRYNCSIIGRYCCQSSERRGRKTAAEEEDEEEVAEETVVGMVDEEEDEEGGCWWCCCGCWDLDDGGMEPSIMNRAPWRPGGSSCHSYSGGWWGEGEHAQVYNRSSKSVAAVVVVVVRIKPEWW